MSSNPSIEELKPYEANTLKLLREIHLNPKFELKPAEYAVFSALALHRNIINYQCNPSITTLSGELHISERHIKTCLKSLTEKRFIRITNKFNSYMNKRTSSQYWLLPDNYLFEKMMEDVDARNVFQSHFDDMVLIYEHEFIDGDGCYKY